MPPQKRNKKNQPLPARWRFKNGAYRYRVPPHLKHLWDDKSEFTLGKTLAEAHKTFAARIAQSERLDTMRSVLTRYLHEVVPTKSPSTQKSNQYSIARLISALGDAQPTQVTPKLAYQYMDAVSKAKSKKHANLDFEVLSHALSIAVAWGVIDRNPVKGQVRKYSLKGRKHKVATPDLLAFAETLPRKWQLYLSLKLLTRGRRKGELLGIRLPDLQEDGIHFVNNKDPDDYYVVEWTPEIRQVVEEILSIPPRRIGAAHLFLTRNGSPYLTPDGRTDTFDSMWGRYMRKAVKDGVERFTENDLRKKAVEGESLMDIQKLLRHSSPQVSRKHYAIGDRIKPK